MRIATEGHLLLQSHDNIAKYLYGFMNDCDSSITEYLELMPKCFGGNFWKAVIREAITCGLLFFILG